MGVGAGIVSVRFLLRLCAGVVSVRFLLLLFALY